MAEVWKPQAIEIYQSWCSAITMEASDNLNDWESTFVFDVTCKLDVGQNLTQSQAEKLEQIYTKHTS